MRYQKYTVFALQLANNHQTASEAKKKLQNLVDEHKEKSNHRQEVRGVVEKVTSAILNKLTHG